jgi:hypothetical protein
LKGQKSLQGKPRIVGGSIYEFRAVRSRAVSKMLATVIIPEVLMKVSVGSFGCNGPAHHFRYLGMTRKSQSSLHDKI